MGAAASEPNASANKTTARARGRFRSNFCDTSLTSEGSPFRRSDFVRTSRSLTPTARRGVHPRVSLARVILSSTPRAAIGAGLAAHLSLASRCASFKSPDDEPVDPEIVDGAEGPRGPPGGTGVVLPRKHGPRPRGTGAARAATPTTPLRWSRAPQQQLEVRKSWLVALISSPRSPQSCPGEAVVALAWHSPDTEHGRVRLGRIVARRHGAHATGSVRGHRGKIPLGRGDRALAFELADG